MLPHIEDLVAKYYKAKFLPVNARRIYTVYTKNHKFTRAFTIHDVHNISYGKRSNRIS